MTRKIRRMILALAGSLAFALGAGLLYMRVSADRAGAIFRKASAYRSSKAGTAASPLTESDVLELYSISQGGFFIHHPVEQRLIHLGKDVALPPLIELFDDNSQGAGVRYWALRAMFSLNDPRVIQSCIKFVKLMPQASTVFMVVLPVSPDSQYCQPGTGVALLEKEIADEPYPQFILHLLDKRIQDKDLQAFDNGVMRWLNRYNGYDLDERLGMASASAVAFRNAELRRGYDPLMAYWAFFPQMNNNYVPKGGLAEVFPNPDEREACKKLFAAYKAEEVVAQHSLISDAWRERLTRWYTAARPYLKWDPSLCRFTVQADEHIVNRIRELDRMPVTAPPPSTPQLDSTGTAPSPTDLLYPSN